MLKHIFYSVKLLLISLLLSSSINLSAQTRDQLYTIYTSISEQKGEIGASSDEVLWFVADKDYLELEITQNELIIFSKNDDAATMKDISISAWPWASYASIITKAKFANKVNSGTTLQSLFKDCAAMTSVDLSELNTQNNTSFNSAFMGCKSLKSIDLSTINAEKVTSVAFMFSNCESLEELDFSTWTTKKKEFANVYTNSPKIKKITTGENWNITISKIPQNSSHPYWYDENGEIVTSISTGAHVYTCELISEYYSIYNEIADVDAKGDIGKKSEEVLWFVADKEYTSLSGRIISANELIIFPKYSKETSTMKAINACPWSAKASVITKASFVEPVNSGNELQELFKACVNLISIDFNNNFNTASCTTFSQMFYDCKKLESIDLSQLNAEKVISIASMFSGCHWIKQLDFSSWTTKEFIQSTIFSDCTRLVDIITGENWNITINNMPTKSGDNFTFVDLNSDEKIAQIITPGAHRYIKSDLPCYKIKVSVENPLLGTATAKISDVQFTKALIGDIVNLKAVVNDEQNYKFDKWLIKPSKGEAFYQKGNQFTMEADDVEFVAIFKKKYDDITKKRLQLILHYKDLDFDE